MSGLSDCFDRLGKVFGEWEDVNDHQTAIESSLQGASGINSEFVDLDRDQIDVLSGNMNKHIDAQLPHLRDLRTAAQKILIEEVDALKVLDTKDVKGALDAMYELLDDNTETVEEAGSASIAAFSAAAANTGDGAMIADAVDFNGNTLHNMRNETITFKCIKDVQGRGLQEQFDVRGEPAVCELHRDHPEGSALRIIVKNATPSVEQQKGPGGNYVVNGDFNRVATVNSPDQWNVSGATPGTSLIKETAVTIFGDVSLKFVKSGAETTEIYQKMNDSGVGSPIALTPKTKLCIAAWVQEGATAPTGAGRLVISFVDSGGTILSGTTALTIDITALTGVGTWDLFMRTLWVPLDIPSEVRLRCKVTPVMPNANETFFLGGVAVAEMAQDPQRKGSPWVAVFGGEEPWVVDDEATIAVTRTDGKLQRYLDKAFDLHGNGVQFPTDDTAGATYKDALVS